MSYCNQTLGDVVSVVSKLYYAGKKALTYLISKAGYNL